jgi:integrase
VKFHGREVAARVFERRADAIAWEQDQRRRLRLGEWTDPRRGRVPLSDVAAEWLNSRGLVKRRTRESDESNWRNYVRPRFGNWPVAAITAAEVSAWVGGLVDRGLAPATATRALATLRSILAFAVADGRVQHNVAAAVRRPTSGRARREGQALTLDVVHALTARPAQARIATWCRSWRQPACAGASWLASRSATGYLCLVLACG